VSASVIVSRSFIDRNGCWVWRQAPRNGYGRVGNRAAHRVSYEIYRGPIPEGFHIHHACGQKLCVNPLHLEAISPREHVLERHPETIAPAISAARAERRRQQRALTHCVNGHEFTRENTYVRKEGWRMCRACMRDRLRARKAAA